MSGRGSVEAKLNGLSSLLRGVSPVQGKYIVRFTLGRLRLGIGDPTVLEALALAAGDRALKGELERAYNLCSDLALVAGTLKQQGMDGIGELHIKVGYPVRMALCERLPSAADIIEKMGEAAVEAKYDGFRCQVHKDGEKVTIFSRNLNLMTDMFPEIVQATRGLKAESVIFEGEALAHNEATGELYPFQVTMKRRRKHNIAEMQKDNPLRFFAFELLYLNGRDMTIEPYERRREKLVELISGSKGIEPATMFRTTDAAEIERHFEEFVETGLEGVVAKRLDMPYTAGARNFNWIKLKRSYRGELADTVDVCIVGYFRGKGQRARFGVGAVLGAVYDPGTDTFKTISKVGTGFTEQDLQELGQRLRAISLEHVHARVESRMQADVWVEPRYVIEVTADEITRSPLHTAGQQDDGMGYALRFPRAVDPLRDDKRPEDANTVAEVIAMAGAQKQIKVK